jgi:hypothetical protein
VIIIYDYCKKFIVQATEFLLNAVRVKSHPFNSLLAALTPND